MEKKYELTDETIEIITPDDETIGEPKKYTLHRIRALKDFDNVKKGDLGGFIESEENLSLKGDCWVYDNAKVYGEAMVYDNARVFDNAKVYDRARIYDKAEVYENVKVYCKAEVYDKAVVGGDAKIYGKAEVYG